MEKNFKCSVCEKGYQEKQLKFNLETAMILTDIVVLENCRLKLKLKNCKIKICKILNKSLAKNNGDEHVIAWTKLVKEMIGLKFLIIDCSNV